jgi:hypothetical protein
VKVNFSKDQWDMSEWQLVRYPGTDHKIEWIQHKDCIANSTPQDAEPDDLCEGGKYSSLTHTGMILKQAFKKPTRISSTMSFDHRMAPLIHICKEPQPNGDMPVLQDRYEIIVFDEGINLWEHYKLDGTIKYRKKLFYSEPLKPKTKYCLQVSVKPRDKKLIISLDGLKFEVNAPLLGDEYYAGVMGCEGVNRFYDFEVKDCG